MKTKPVSILLIEAAAHTSQLIKQALAGLNFEAKISHVSAGPAALDLLADPQFDIVIIGHHPPDVNGLALLQQMSRQNKTSTVIFMAEAGAEATIKEAIELGIHSYLIKDAAEGYLTLLPSLIGSTHQTYQQHHSVTQALRETSMALTSTLDLTTILDNILIYLERVVPYNSACVFLFAGKELQAMTSRGFPDPSRILRQKFPADTPLVRELTQAGQTIVIPDVRQDPRFEIEGWGDNNYIRGWMGVPLIVRNKILGYITLDSVEVAKYSSVEAQLAQAFANQAAIAIENAQLFEETRQRAEQLEALYQVATDLTTIRDHDRLLRQIAERAIQFFKGENGCVYLYRPEKDALELVVGIGVQATKMVGVTIPKSEGIANKIWHSNSPLYVENYFEWPGRSSLWTASSKTVVGVPIQWEGEVLGVLSIGLVQTHAQFAEGDFSLLSLFAAQAALAIQNAHFFEKERHRAEQLAILHQASLELTSSLELHPVLENILKTVLKFLPSTHDAHLFIVEEGKLIFGAGWDQGYKTQPISQPRPQGLTHTVARQGKTVVIPDMRRHPLYVDAPLNHKWEGSLVGIPLKIGQRVIGVMNVHSPEIQAWTDADLSMLQLLADQAAIAIENTRLYQEQHVHRREAQALHQAALALVSTVKLDEVIDLILMELQKVVPYDSASVQLLRGNQTEIIGGRGFPDLSKLIGFNFDLKLDKNRLNKTVLETQQPLIIHDTAAFPDCFQIEPHNIVETQSWLAVPMLLGQQPLGLITLDKLEANFYQENHAHLAEAFATQAAIAIQNAQLHQSTAGSLSQLTRLYELSNEFVSTLSLGEVAHLVIEKVVQATQAHSAVLHLIDQFGNFEMIVGSDEMPPRSEGTTMKIFRTGQVLLFDGQSEASIDLPAHLVEQGIKASIGLPLKADERIIGVMFVRHNRPHHFSKSETETLFIFANQSAVAIQNARLYEQAQQEIGERKRVQAALNEYQTQLENLVRERTAKLEQAMTEADEAKDKINAILQSVADGLIVTDVNHQVVLANPAAEQLLDFSLKAMLNESAADASQNNWLKQFVQSTLSHRIQVSEIDVKLESPNKKQAKILHSRTALVNGQQEKPLGTVTIIRDVTRLREVDRLKTEFLSIAAHELRTPLTSILGFSEILLNRQLDKNRKKRYLTLINEQAAQLAEIVNNLLDISRLEAGKGLELNIQPLDMERLLRDTAKPFIETTSKHHFQFEGLTNLPLVKGDKLRLGQVSKNLLSNAVKYSPEGGNIIIRSLVKSDRIEFSVQDEGLGITPEHQNHLFEKFYRADNSHTAIGGTGLGLAISKLIIDLHHSSMWVESQPNIGTAVHFTLPRADNPSLEPHT